MSEHNKSESQSCIGTNNSVGIQCDCGSKNTEWVGGGGYQEADASRRLPEIETNGLVWCRDCNRTWWD